MSQTLFAPFQNIFPNQGSSPALRGHIADRIFCLRPSNHSAADFSVQLSSLRSQLCQNGVVGDCKRLSSPVTTNPHLRWKNLTWFALWLFIAINDIAVRRYFTFSGIFLEFMPQFRKRFMWLSKSVFSKQQMQNQKWWRLKIKRPVAQTTTFRWFLILNSFKSKNYNISNTH